MFVKYAIGLSCLSIVTSICPASSGEQAIARLGSMFTLQWAMLQCEPCRREEPGQLVIFKNTANMPLPDFTRVLQGYTLSTSISPTGCRWRWRLTPCYFWHSNSEHRLYITVFTFSCVSYIDKGLTGKTGNSKGVGTINVAAARSTSCVKERCAVLVRTACSLSRNRLCVSDGGSLTGWIDCINVFHDYGDDVSFWTRWCDWKYS